MDFTYSEEQLLICHSSREFAEKKIAPTVFERDMNEHFPRKIIQELGEMGYFGILLPEEKGGTGFDSISFSLLIEELSKVEASVGLIISVINSLVASTFHRYGNVTQKKKYLNAILEGKYFGTFALSENVSGNDTAYMQTYAKLTGNTYVINGEKSWVTFADNASIFIVFARTNSGSESSRLFSAFIMEKEVDGLEIIKKSEKMGLRSSNIASIRFNNVRLAKENLIGEEGEGSVIAKNLLDIGQIGLASQAMGIAKACLRMSINYAKERKQFGQTLSKFQMIQLKISEMATKIEATRLLIYKACELRDKNKISHTTAAMARWMSSETAVFCAEEAVQIFGGSGYMKDFPVERYFRDAKVTELYDGSFIANQTLIAEEYLK